MASAEYKIPHFSGYRILRQEVDFETGSLAGGETTLGKRERAVKQIIPGLLGEM